MSAQASSGLRSGENVRIRARLKVFSVHSGEVFNDMLLRLISTGQSMSEVSTLDLFLRLTFSQIIVPKKYAGRWL